MTDPEKEDPNSPERIAAARRFADEFRRAVGRGDLSGDVTRAETDATAPPSSRSTPTTPPQPERRERP